MKRAFGVQGYGKDKRKAKTKTKSGNRIILMTDTVYDLFRQQRKYWFSMDKRDPDFEIDGFKNFVFLSNRTGKN